jgi:predicted metal-dependent phosphoesterase TrpH
MKISADLHIHTALSTCGSLDMSPAAIIKRAKELSLDVIAITDHNSIENSFYVAEIGEREGIKVIYGMEAQTIEEVHILCYFEHRKEIERFYSEIYDNLPMMKNDPEYFGDQVVVDSENNIIRFEEKLLLNSLNLDIEELMEKVKYHGGYLIPAHIEREQFGLLVNLGFIPESLKYSVFEISYNADLKEILKFYPFLKNKNLISNSDAHYLEDMARAYTIYDVKEKRMKDIYLAALNGQYKVIRGKK